MTKTLTPREARFVEEYASTRNAKQSALAAGYAAKSAAALGPRALRKAHIVAALNERGVAIAPGPRPPGQRRHEAAHLRKGLSGRQRRFVEEYLLCGNATEAARRIGLSEANAKSNGARLLARRGVAEAIKAEQEASARRTGITVDRVKRELARLAFVEIGDIADWDGDALVLRPRAAISRDDRAAIAELKVKHGENGARITVRLHSKQAALIALAKHFGLFEKGAAAPSREEQEAARRNAKEELRARLKRIMEGATDAAPAGEASEAKEETKETQK
ncbi:MAG TPA: terminase small subunit [Stellaceae bacterium]|jgi:phage terminase small subunit